MAEDVVSWGRAAVITGRTGTHSLCFQRVSGLH